MARKARRRSKKTTASSGRPAAPSPEGLAVEAVKTTRGRAATSIHVEVEADRLPGAEPPEDIEVVAQVPKADEADGPVQWEEQPLAPQGESVSGGARKLRYVATRYEGTDADRYGLKVRVKTKAGAVEKEGIPVHDAGCHGGSGPDGTPGK